MSRYCKKQKVMGDGTLLYRICSFPALEYSEVLQA